MKNSTQILLILMMILGLTFTVKSQDCELKMDGVYVSVETDVEDDIKKYLRFYDDGEVISTASVFGIPEVVKWFSKKADDISIGEYKQAGCDLNFFTRNSGGKYYFEGMINEDGRLEMNVLYPGQKKKKHMISINYQFVKTE